MAGKRTSLGKVRRYTAEQIVISKNQALWQQTLNFQIAKALLAGSDSGVAMRTWGQATQTLIETKDGETRKCWYR